MQLEITPKGALHSCECTRCGATIYAHEWAHVDFNERRDAMLDGCLPCDECGIGKSRPDTYVRERRSYAARYSAPGYLDCTDWSFDTNRRRLIGTVRFLYT